MQHILSSSTEDQTSDHSTERMTSNHKNLRSLSIKSRSLNNFLSELQPMWQNCLANMPKIARPGGTIDISYIYCNFNSKNAYICCNFESKIVGSLIHSSMLIFSIPFTLSYIKRLCRRTLASIIYNWETL